MTVRNRNRYILLCLSPGRSDNVVTREEMVLIELSLSGHITPAELKNNHSYVDQIYRPITVGSVKDDKTLPQSSHLARYEFLQSATTLTLVNRSD